MKNMISLVVALSVFGFTAVSPVMAHEGEDHSKHDQNKQQHDEHGQGGGQDQHQDKQHQDKQHKHDQHKHHHKHDKQQ